MNRTIPCLDIDFESTDYQENLYRYYGDFLKHTPVFTTQEGSFYLTRFADCDILLKEPRFTRRPKTGPSVFSKEEREPNNFEAMLNDWMVFQDPPHHTRLRSSLNSIFTPKRIYAMESDIHQIARSLLDTIPCNQPVDFVGQFAYLLPLSVICLMLGIEQADYKKFSVWSNRLTSALNTGSGDDMLHAVEAAAELKNYFKDHVGNSEPHGSKDTIFKALLEALGSGGLTVDEVINICTFMLWAGHETTKHLVSNGLFSLLQNPMQMQLLKSDFNLLDSAVEEMLRVESPVQKISRWVREDTYFGDYLIPGNQLVTVLIGTANRDPAVFDRPNEFLIERSPNRHIAFGKGIHHCLGASLARFEAKIAAQEILNRYNKITLIDYQWRNYSAFRSLDHLTLRLET